MTPSGVVRGIVTTSLLRLGAPAGASEGPTPIHEAEVLLQAARRRSARLTAGEYVREAARLIDEAKARHADAQGHADHHAAATNARVPNIVAQLAIAASQ